MKTKRRYTKKKGGKRKSRRKIRRKGGKRCCPPSRIINKARKSNNYLNKLKAEHEMSKIRSDISDKDINNWLNEMDPEFKKELKKICKAIKNNRENKTKKR
tara:strand:- start:16 stop:318 length:303 start_codon:yes stop_codon:yes gene_type:complete